MNDEKLSDEAISIELNEDEALVLFALLSRWIDDPEAPTPGPAHFKSPGECAALQGLLCELERKLSAPLQKDFARRLAAARERLATHWDGETLRD